MFFLASLISQTDEVCSLFCFGKGAEHGYMWLAANDLFCQILRGVCSLSPSNPSSAGFSISAMFDMKDGQNQVNTGCLTWLHDPDAGSTDVVHPTRHS